MTQSRITTQSFNVVDEIINTERTFLGNVAGLKTYLNAYEQRGMNLNSPSYTALKTMQTLAQALLDKYPNGPDWITTSIKNGEREFNFDEQSRERFNAYQKECEPLYLLSKQFTGDPIMQRAFENDAASMKRSGILTGTLESYTAVPIQPVQRFLRHGLLLSELDKNINGKHRAENKTDLMPAIASALSDSKLFSSSINARPQEQLTKLLSTAQASITRIQEEQRARSRQTTTAMQDLPVAEQITARINSLINTIQQTESSIQKAEEEIRLKRLSIDKFSSKNSESESKYQAMQPSISTAKNNIIGNLQTIIGDAKKESDAAKQFEKYIAAQKKAGSADLYANISSAVINNKLSGANLAYALKVAIQDNLLQLKDVNDIFSSVSESKDKKNGPLLAALEKSSQDIATIKAASDLQRDIQMNTGLIKRNEDQTKPTATKVSRLQTEIKNARAEIVSLNFISELHNKITSGEVSSAYLKENWSLLNNAKSSQLFSEFIAPKLSAEQLTAFNNTLLKAQQAGMPHSLFSNAIQNKEDRSVTLTPGDEVTSTKSSFTQDEFTKIQLQILTELSKYAINGKNPAHKSERNKLIAEVNSWQYDSKNSAQGLTDNIKGLIDSMQEQLNTIIANRGVFRNMDGRYTMMLQKNIGDLYYVLGAVGAKLDNSAISNAMREMATNTISNYAKNYPTPKALANIANQLVEALRGKNDLNEISKELQSALDKIHSVPLIRRVLMGADSVRLESMVKHALNTIDLYKDKQPKLDAESAPPRPGGP